MAHWPAALITQANQASASTVPPNVSYKIKSCAEDFEVAEYLDFVPDGRKNHLFMYVEKSLLTSREVAHWLSQRAGVAPDAIGYAGMKDKVGVTRQWFSVPNGEGANALRRELELSHEPASNAQPSARIALGEGSLRLLAMSFHGRKLRRGQLVGNRFALCLRDVGVDNKSFIEQRLLRLRARGFPNYFGPQRFGIEQSNLGRATAWLNRRQDERDPKHLGRNSRGRNSRGRNKGRGDTGSSDFARGLHLSVLRAFLFNEVLAARVRAENWTTSLDGDHSINGGVTAPLWGRGRSQTKRVALAVESAALAPHESLQAGLEYTGVQQMRRRLVVLPQGLSWFWQGQDVWLRFQLPAGAYATTMLAELGTTYDLSQKAAA